MRKTASSFELPASRKYGRFFSRFRLAARSSQLAAGFTLIETLVAVSILTIAIVAPMTLAAQSLSAAAYARDGMIAFQLGQEAIEAVRHLRDHNVLVTLTGGTAGTFDGIPIGTPFVIDTFDDHITTPGCSPALRTQTGGSIYAYGSVGSDASCTAPVGWTNSPFTRMVTVTNVVAGEEILVQVVVTWKSRGQNRTFTISENLYNWPVIST